MTKERLPGTTKPRPRWTGLCCSDYSLESRSYRSREQNQRAPPYSDDSDWVFASHLNKGQKPYWPDMLRKRHLVPTAVRLGIKKLRGWHTFRRTYASLLKAAGTDVKVV
jgi:hypothetical protein